MLDRAGPWSEDAKQTVLFLLSEPILFVHAEMQKDRIPPFKVREDGLVGGSRMAGGYGQGGDVQFKQKK